jgi:hypothetical protein
MANDKMNKMQGYFDPQYDSDEDLTPEDRKKIQSSYNPNKVRKEAWDKADMYPKLKKFVKSSWSGDKRGTEE